MNVALSTFRTLCVSYRIGHPQVCLLLAVCLQGDFCAGFKPCSCSCGAEREELKQGGGMRSLFFFLFSIGVGEGGLRFFFLWNICASFD